VKGVKGLKLIQSNDRFYAQIIFDKKYEMVKPVYADVKGIDLDLIEKIISDKDGTMNVEFKDLVTCRVEREKGMEILTCRRERSEKAEKSKGFYFE